MDKEVLEVLKALQDGQQKLQEGQQKLQEGQNKIETKLDETYQIVRALEHSAEVNKAEHDSIMHDIANIQGEVTAIRKDLSTMEIVTSSNYADIAKLKAVK